MGLMLCETCLQISDEFAPRRATSAMSCRNLPEQADHAAVISRRYPDMPWKPKVAFDAVAEGSAAELRSRNPVQNRR